MPEVTVTRTGRRTVGFDPRLFATHDKGAQALRGCHECRELVAGRGLVPAMLADAGFLAEEVGIYGSVIVAFRAQRTVIAVAGQRT